MKRTFVLLALAAALLLLAEGTRIPIYINVTVGSGADEFYSRVWKRLLEEKPDYVDITTSPSTKVVFRFDLTLLDLDKEFEAIWKEGTEVIADLKYEKDSLLPLKFYIQDVVSIPLEKAAFKKASIGDFGNALRLTYNSGVDEYPSFSPDGRYLLFSSDRFTGNRDIYVLDLSKASLRRINIGGSSDYFPKVSPNGKLIAFQGSLYGNWGVFTIPFSGDVRALRRIAGGRTAVYMPSWINDNEIVAVKDEGNGNVLCIYNLKDRRCKSVKLPWRYVFSPYPISENEFLVTALNKADFGIYKVTTSGSYTAVENTRYNEHDPILSPDGKVLLFTSNRDGVYRVWAKNLENGKVWVVTGDIDYDAFYPSFHPSGKYIAVSVYKPGWEPDIWLVRVNGM